MMQYLMQINSEILGVSFFTESGWGGVHCLHSSLYVAVFGFVAEMMLMARQALGSC